MTLVSTLSGPYRETLENVGQEHSWHLRGDRHEKGAMMRNWSTYDVYSCVVERAYVSM